VSNVRYWFWKLAIKVYLSFEDAVSVSAQYWLKNGQFCFTIGNALRFVRCASTF
jgi:hypothetical protein